MAADTESQLRQEHALRGQEEGEPCGEVIVIDAAVAAQSRRRRWHLVAVGASGLLGAALVLAVLGREVGPSATTTLASRALQAAPALAAAPAPSAEADGAVNQGTSAGGNAANQMGDGGGGVHAAPNTSITSQALNASITSQVCMGPGTTMDYFKRWWTPNRNNWHGEVGFTFTVGSQDICVVALGRALTARGQRLRAGTRVQLWDARSRQAVTQAYVGDDVHVAPHDEYAMVELPYPVTLAAHTEYAVSQTCTNGMDNWVDTTSTITENEAETRYITIGQGAFSYNTGYPSITDGQGRRAGMLQIRFSVPTMPTCSCNHQGVQNGIPPGRSSARFYCWLTVDTGCQLLTGQTVYWSWANCFHNFADQIDCTQEPVCDLHPNCRAAGLSGDCCPTAAGTSLGCCSQADLYSVHDGYIPSGGTILVEAGWRSVEAAKARCSRMPSCKGFTFRGHLTEFVDIFFKNTWAVYGAGSGWTSYKREQNPSPAKWCYDDFGQVPATELWYSGSDHACSSTHGQCHWPSQNAAMTWSTSDVVDYAKDKCSAWSECQALYCSGRHTNGIYVCYARKSITWITEAGSKGLKKVRCQNPNPNPNSCNEPYEYQVNYPDNDVIVDGRTSTPNIHSARSCATFCSSRNIPFFSYGHAFPFSGECWCKSAQRNRVSGHSPESESITSGKSCVADWACPDFEVNRNYPFNDIPVNGRSPTFGISSAVACGQHCAEHRAPFFTHHHHSEACYCKGRLEYGHYEDYFTSGETCQKGA